MSTKPTNLVTQGLQSLTELCETYEKLTHTLGTSCYVKKPLGEGYIEKEHQKTMDLYMEIQTKAIVFGKTCRQGAPRGSSADAIPIKNLESYTGSRTLLDRVEQAFHNLNNSIRTKYPLAKITELETRVGDIASTRELTKPNPELAKFPYFRKILGDGNCFYTSFTVRFLETFVEKSNIGEAALNFIMSNGESSKLQEFVVCKLMDLQQNPASLKKILKDNQVILPFVKYFRSIVANEMLTNKKDYEETFSISLSGDFPKEADYILSQDYDKLVEAYVSTMGKDATDVSISILCKLFNFPCKIYSQGYSKPLDTIPSQAKSPRAILFRAQEHYFLAYTEADKMHADVKEKEKKMNQSLTSSERGGSLPKIKQEKTPVRKDPVSFDSFEDLPPSLFETEEDDLDDAECLRLADQFVNELTTEDPSSEDDEPMSTLGFIPFTRPTTTSSSSSSSSFSSTSSTASSSKKPKKKSNIIEAFEF